MIEWDTEYFKVWCGTHIWTEKLSVVNNLGECYLGNIDDLIFLRNTFVKDKDNNDIFEGDIVYVMGHYESDTWYEEENRIIEYDDGGFNIDKAEVHNYGIYIIGNIYEGQT